MLITMIIIFIIICAAAAVDNITPGCENNE